jgi:miniconductance mechanosensitive channel
MEHFLDSLQTWFLRVGLTADAAQLATTLSGLVGLILLAALANFVAKRIILRIVTKIVMGSRFTWDNVMLQTGVFTRLSHLAPALVINSLGPTVLGASPDVFEAVRMAVNLYLIFIWLGVLYAVLNAFHLLAEEHGRMRGVPVKGFVQAFKLIATLLAIIFALALMLGKSPLLLLSGLGALTAVLLLVFRDAILGFVAGIMISTNEIVRVGDWIEMPSAGADGDVVDVSLTTVKVRNWDKTITTIPTYNLISESFKNWRGMKESGGRRIKRSIYLDMQSIRFADAQMLERWKKISHVREHLNRKLAEIAEDNQRLGPDANVLGNGRRLTNVGTFRAYCISYLRAHKMIHQDMTFLVRQLQPTAHGLPLEIYVFVNDTTWAVYEGVQADIFDHLLAVLGCFDLRVYQHPSGYDVLQVAGRSPGAAIAAVAESAESLEDPTS